MPAGDTGGRELIMKWIAFGLVLLAAAAIQAPVAQATVLIFTSPLSGLSESPPNASPGTGNATVIIDDAADTLSVHVEFSGLLGNTNASHIHCCTAVPGSGNVGVATETPTFSNFPLGVKSGTFDQSYNLLADATYNSPFLAANLTAAGAEAALIKGLLENRAYLNIHSDFSTQFKAGEIRGFLQLTAVPEPSSLLLLASAFFGMLPFARRH